MIKKIKNFFLEKLWNPITAWLRRVGMTTREGIAWTSLVGVAIAATLVPSVAIQNDVNAVVSQIEVAQEEYIKTHEGYFQGIQNMDFAPATDTPAVWSRKPTDQAETWNDLPVVLPNKTSFQVTIHSYESSEGHGYQVFFKIESNGDIYLKEIGYGPEATRRTKDWFLFSKSKIATST